MLINDLSEQIIKDGKYIRKTICYKDQDDEDDEEPLAEQTGAWATNMTMQEELDIKTWLASSPEHAKAAHLVDDNEFKKPEEAPTMLTGIIQKTIFDAITFG
eukprot:7309967-Heterocapsa_arctica.AAC.2